VRDCSDHHPSDHNPHIPADFKRLQSGVIGDLRHTGLAGAVGAAVEGAIRFDTMPNDLATAVVADWRQLVDGTLKTIEHMALASGYHLEGQIVVISTYFTRSHG